MDKQFLIDLAKVLLIVAGAAVALFGTIAIGLARMAPNWGG